jgi:diadenosine tetraphosphate (Ap4A) HIT family hydrolase
MSDSANSICPFCSPSPERILATNVHAIALRDAYPVSVGHTLIVSRRHVADFFELSEAEWLDMMALLRPLKHQLDQGLHPAGYNIGVNVGPAAGQTVPHAHVHLIPRYPGDVGDPVGGVRNVIPGKGDYRSAGAGCLGILA